MRNVIVDDQHQSYDAFEKIGYNLLEEAEVTIMQPDGTQPEMKNRATNYDENAHKEITLPYDTESHIDIFSRDFKLTYSLKEEATVNTIFISGHASPGNYMVNDFEFYMSKNLDDLYQEENLIYHVDFTKMGHSSRYSEFFFHIGEETLKYFGVKFNNSCKADEIARVGTIALFNDEQTKSILFMKNNFEKSVLTADGIDLAKADAEKLVDGVVFDGNGVEIEKSVILTPDKAGYVVMLCGKYGKFKVYTSDDKANLFESPVTYKAEEVATDAEEICHNIVLDAPAKKHIGIEFVGGANLDQIGVYSYFKKVECDLDTVRNEDFIGIGGNDLPMAWMPESREKGFLNVYWPIYEHRLIKSKPATMRVWFQPDWIVDNEEDYKIGKCDFNTPKMKGVFKYLDAYEKADIDVNLNFGWKVSTEIQDWFSIPHTGQTIKGGPGRGASAPKDFDGFAKCCASLIREICVNRGYKCVKHLTFFNESGYGDMHKTVADFQGYFGRSMEMWEKMLRRCDQELKEQGLSDCVDFWVPEISGSNEMEFEWLDHFTKNCPEYANVNTFHRYALTYDVRLKFFEEILKNCNGRPAYAGEFAVYSPANWIQSNVEYVMSMLRSGLSGGMYWILQGVMLTDPVWIYLGGGDRENWWCPPYERRGLIKENIPYHEFSLFTHYCPRHSKVLECEKFDDDIRAEVIMTPDGEYTIFVESNAAHFDKDITINLGKKIGKTFRKHVFRREGLVRDGNLTVPPCEAEIEVDDVLQDKIGGEYCLIAYTTMPSFKQVKMEKTEYMVRMGDEKVQLKAELLDCEGEIEWSIVAMSGPECFIDQNGVFTQGEGTHGRSEDCGDLYCVKAQLKGDENTYGVAMVRIIP